MKKTYLLFAITLFFFLTDVFFCSAQPSNWQARGVGSGGSMFYPSINPVNDNEFYVTCDMSQLFHSTDFGASYTQVPFTKLQTGNISTYEFTSNSNNAYCIANDGNINYGVRTTDCGNTWAALPGQLPMKITKTGLMWNEALMVCILMGPERLPAKEVRVIPINLKIRLQNRYCITGLK